MTSQIDHRQERRLIVCCARTAATTDLITEVHSILGNSLDWEFIIQVSTRNAVAPLINSFLLNNAESAVPTEIRKAMLDYLVLHQARNLFLTSQMLKVVELFQRNDIPIVPFKGPLLAIQAYGNPCLRFFTDLDVLVQPSRFKSAVKLLSENSFTPMTSVSWLEQRDWYISRKKDIYFVSQNRSVTFELHWKLSGSHFGLPREMDRLWDRLEVVELGNREVKTLSFYDQMIYLCLHGARHSWERLQWICDLHELIKSKHDIDWNLLFCEANRFGCDNVVALGLRLVFRFFDYNVTHPANAKGETEPIYDEMVREIEARLFSEKVIGVNIDERYFYHLSLKERLSDKWKIHYHYCSWYIRLIFKPNEADRSALQFPPFLSPLYYITRPIRLVYAYLLRGRT